MAIETLIEGARKRVRKQRQWIEDHGSSRAAYVARYGSKHDPDHHGDGGEAIHAADVNKLNEYLDELNALLRRQRRKAS